MKTTGALTSSSFSSRRTRRARTRSINALQLVVEKRFSHGFTLSANYTWSKSIDPVSYSTDLDTINIINPFNLNAYRGVSDFNVPHRFVLNYLWQLPSPKAGVAARRAGRMADVGDLDLQSGFPLNISSGNDTSFSLPAVGNDQAQQLCTPHYTSGRRSNRIASWFDTQCYRRSGGQHLRKRRTQHADRTGHVQRGFGRAQGVRAAGERKAAAPGRILQHVQPHTTEQSGYDGFRFNLRKDHQRAVASRRTTCA